MNPQSLSNLDQPIILIDKILKQLRNRFQLNQYPKVTTRVHQADYTLDSEALSPMLCRDLDDLLDARVNLDSKINCFTEKVDLNSAMPQMGWTYRLLGWQHRVEKISLEELGLTHLVSFAPVKTALRQAKSYDEERLIKQATQQASEDTQETLTRALKWLRKERQISPSTEKNIVDVFLVTAKFLYYKETDASKAANYGDIPVIVMLRGELKKAKKRAKNVLSVADESLKWLDWPEFLACVHHLEEECQPCYIHGVRRTPTAIARSYQRYLLFALLAYIPTDRQRTLRELEVGKTLVRGIFHNNRVFEAREDGDWYIHLKKQDYKTGENHGDQWLMVPKILYPYLEAWLSQERAKFSPSYNFVFTKENGKPYETASELSGIIKRATYRLAGKLTTSHLIRHMLVTYMKQNGASDEVMRSLAEAMHRSTKMQTEIYDRRPNLEKVAAAQEIVLNLATGKPVSHLMSGRSLTVEEIAHHVQQLSFGDRQHLLALLNQS